MDNAKILIDKCVESLSCRFASQKITVGLSGGVDSSVCAYLLKEAGLDVSCLHMVCWRSDDSWCTSDGDMNDAISVASALSLKIEIVDYTNQYKKKVFDYFIDSYKNGLTPSPDLVCNKEIKFGLGLDHAISSENRCFATGHYAQIKSISEIDDPLIKENVAPRIKSILYRHPYTQKDQSYFLSTIIENQNIDKVIFPLAFISNKDDVRKIADYVGLKNSKKPDSQGMCFIGNVSMTKFLPNYIKDAPGKVIKVDGEVIGQHKGLHLYTIGQRHGFDTYIYNGNPLYVVGKKLEQNELVVGTREQCYQDTLKIKLDELIIENKKMFEKLSKDDKFAVRIRSSGDFEKVRHLEIINNDTITVVSKRPIFGCAPGQTCVFYYAGAIIASGTISL